MEHEIEEVASELNELTLQLLRVSKTLDLLKLKLLSVTNENRK